MRIKTLLSSIIVFFAIGFISCDDDVNTVGESIRPGIDDVKFWTDSVALSARTVSFNDSVYARTTIGLLGEYKDKIFGDIKSDFLAEFFCSETQRFQDKVLAIDSVKFEFLMGNLTGDSTLLTGISVYELNKNLDKNYFTNIKPTDYCDMSKRLAEGAYTYKEIKSAGTDYNITNADGVKIPTKFISAMSDTLLGKRFLQEWRQRPESFKNSESFRKFFPGIYVTSSYGEGNLTSVYSSYIGIYYKYMGRNVANTEDSIRTTVFSMAVTPEVIQMNRVKNDIPSSILQDDPKRTYMMTPAGVYTEITIPFAQVMKMIGTNKTINTATFSLKGLSEEELGSSYGRPTTLLFVNRDSINNFFVTGLLENNENSYLMTRTASRNSYDFNIAGNNIYQLVKHYIDKYKDTEESKIPDLKYLLIPVERQKTTSASGAASTIRISNLMTPSSAILRTDPENMQMKFVFSQYANPTNK